MAYRHLTLRPLKLTHRTTDDVTRCVDIHRGMDESGSIPLQCSISDVEDTLDLHEQSVLASAELEDPTSYELECKASVAAWEEVRSSIFIAVTESYAMQNNQKCFNCENSAILRCVRCGPVAFYCEKCFSEFHKSVNIFHVAEKWEVSDDTCFLHCI